MTLKELSKIVYDLREDYHDDKEVVIVDNDDNEYEFDFITIGYDGKINLVMGSEKIQ